MELELELVNEIRKAQHIVILTGAGISAESGVPTFRQAQTGLWARYDPMELATPQAFMSHPQLVWEWYQWRRQLLLQVEPNDAHHALATMARLVPRLTLITQNVDGLHQRAGSEDVIELHGNIHRNKCFDENRLLDHWDEGDESPPRCPGCGGMIRPDVVWFGENLPAEQITRAFEAARSGDMFLCIGTSALVHPAASLPWEALHRGIPVVEINPQSTPLTGMATWVLAAPAGEALPVLVHRMGSNDLH